MEKSKSNKGNDNLTEDERFQLENGLRILASMIAKAYLKEKSLDTDKQQETAKITTYINKADIDERQSHESLTLSVMEAAKLMGISRNLTYEAVRTGQIPYIKVGRRIIIPRAALMKLLSK